MRPIGRLSNIERLAYKTWNQNAQSGQSTYLEMEFTSPLDCPEIANFDYSGLRSGERWKSAKHTEIRFGQRHAFYDLH